MSELTDAWHAADAIERERLKLETAGQALYKAVQNELECEYCPPIGTMHAKQLRAALERWEKATNQDMPASLRR